MANQINLPKDKDLAKQILDNHNEIEKEKIQQGHLGRIWGSSASIPNNIAALAIVVLIITGILYTYFSMNISPEKIWIKLTLCTTYRV